MYYTGRRANTGHALLINRDGDSRCSPGDLIVLIRPSRIDKRLAEVADSVSGQEAAARRKMNRGFGNEANARNDKISARMAARAQRTPCTAVGT